MLNFCKALQDHKDFMYIYKLMFYIREKYHPLFHLRKFRLFQWLTKLLDFPISIRFELIDHKIYGSFSKNLSFVLTRGASGEEKERQNFSKIVKLGAFNSFFDVGANIGLYGFLFKSLVSGNSKVVMVEPDVSNTKLINRTIAKHNIRDIIVIDAAVTDNDGIVDFYKDEVSGASGSINKINDLFVVRHHNINPKKAVVKAVTLDSLSHSTWEPDFIKIDVEGAELKALWGATDLIKRARPAIFFECDSKKEDVLNLLRSSGYTLFDFFTLNKTDTLCHNNLALHNEKHRDLISLINSRV